MVLGLLLGREQQLAKVLEVCRAAAVGRGSTLVVSGEPGIGKTALLRAAAQPDAGSGVEAQGGVAFATLPGLLWPYGTRSTSWRSRRRGSSAAGVQDHPR